MTREELTKQDEVYLAVVNVPKDCTSTNSPTYFVEVRAIMYFIDGLKPYHIIEYNNVNSWAACYINWTEFNLVVRNLVDEHFKPLLEKLKSETV